MKRLSSGILGVLSKYEPGYLAFSLPHLIFASAATLSGVWFPKVFIGQLENRRAFGEIAVTVGVCIIFLAALKCFDSFFVYESDLCREHFVKNIRFLTGKMTMERPLCEIESAGFADKLILSGKVSQITDAFSLFLRIIIDLLTIAGLSVMISTLDTAFLLTIVVVVSVKIASVCLTQRYRKKRRTLYAANDRVGDYLESTAYTNLGAAKEIRINSLSDWYMEKITAFRERMLSLQYGDFNHYAAVEAVSGIILALQSLVILISLARRFAGGVIGIGDFTMYFTAVTTLTLKLSSIISIVGEYNMVKISLNDFDELFAPEETDKKQKNVPLWAENCLRGRLVCLSRKREIRSQKREYNDK